MQRNRFAKTTGAHFVAAWLATAGVACNSPDVFSYCGDRPCREADAGSDSGKRETPLPPDGTVADTGPSRSALCGMTGCFPGNSGACGLATLPGPSLYGPQAQIDDASSSSDAVADAGTDAEDAPGSADTHGDTCHQDGPRDGSADTSLDAAEPDAAEDTTTEPEIDATLDAVEDGTTGDASPPGRDASSTDSGGQRDATSDPAEEPKISQSCYIKPAGTGVVTECAPVGPGAAGSACNDSRQCGALLACVEVEQKAACRRITCFLPPDCSKGTYYQEAPLRADGTTRFDLLVPACLPTDNCTLLDPQSSCPAGKVCAVVGSNGDTTCLVPGTAKLGESCDEINACAEGLLCSKYSNQCVKICHVGDVDSGPGECPTGTCQGGNRSLPDGFGICVGQTDGG